MRRQCKPFQHILSSQHRLMICCSALLDQAITIYELPAWRKSSAARAPWKKSRTLHVMGNTTETAPFLDRALKLRRDLVYVYRERGEEFVDEDWDTSGLVLFKMKSYIFRILFIFC
jgi:hypothetical protein